MPARVPDSEVKHGTYAGSQWHKRKKVPACEPCKAANRKYSAAHRKQRIKAEKLRKANEEVRLSAHRRLAAKYPHEYKELLRQEKEKFLAEKADRRYAVDK